MHSSRRKRIPTQKVETPRVATDNFQVLILICTKVLCYCKYLMIANDALQIWVALKITELVE
jgi:hypothetical protein